MSVYTYIRTGIILVSISCGTAIFWGLVAAGLVRWLFGIDETGGLYIGIAVFVVLFVSGFFFLPKALRKAGMI
jgi:hypothetical protein